MRYLERGPDLPALAIKTTGTSTAKTHGNTNVAEKEGNKYVWLVLILIVSGMVFILKTKRT